MLVDASSATKKLYLYMICHTLKINKILSNSMICSIINNIGSLVLKSKDQVLIRILLL